jgi:hypothetical protein
MKSPVLEKKGRRAELVCCGLVGIVLAWTYSSPFFSARQLISVDTEMLLHFSSFLMSISGLLAYIFIRRTKQPSWRILDFITLFALFVSVGLVCMGWNLSDRFFFNWKMRNTPNETWYSVVKEVNALGAQVVAANDEDFWLPITKNDLPKVFDHIGLRGEFASGRAQMDPGGKEQAVVLVLYGYKSRRWGIYLGDSEYLTSRWPHARIARVTEDLLFFVSPDS